MRSHRAICAFRARHRDDSIVRRLAHRDGAGLRVACVLSLGVCFAVDSPRLLAGPVEFDTRLEIAGPTAPLRTGAEFRATVRLDSSVDNVQGWSLGVAHDPAVLELLGAVAGATTQTVMDGRPPQFLVIDPAPRGERVGVTMAAVISFTQPISISAGEDYELLDIDYRVIADPLSGPGDPNECVDLQSAVAFSDEINVPPVASVLTVAGETNVAELVDLPITVECPPEFAIESFTCEGDTENVYLLWENVFPRGAAWDFFYLYRDGELLAELSLDATSYTDEGLEPGEYLYTLLTVVSGGAQGEPDADPVLLFERCRGTVIPVTIDSIDPVVGYFVGGERVTITGTAFTTAELTTLSFFAAGEEPLLLEDIAIISETELTATVPPSPRLGAYNLRLENERGSAELPDAFEYGFIRGEANADGTLDISDGVTVVGYLFLGEPLGPCTDAADATDDARLDISDAIRIFGYLFNGLQPPDAPFPGPGQDTTPDAFGCLDGVAV